MPAPTIMSSPPPPPDSHDANPNPAQSPASDRSQPTDAHWVVQDILAERTSVSGDNEVLVVWKASWIPVANLRDGPVLRAWRLAPMFTTAAMRMQVMVAMEPGSQLAQDVERVQAAARASKKQRLFGQASHSSK